MPPADSMRRYEMDVRCVQFCSLLLPTELFVTSVLERFQVRMGGCSTFIFVVVCYAVSGRERL